VGRTCEICGGREADKDEKKAGAKNAIESLFVCETCLKDRQSPADVKLV
jgi:protein-arginine kinase activator protein McsA